MFKKGFCFILFFIFYCKTFAIYPPPIKSTKGMVVSEHYLASKAGADILSEGGNAIDAAVAVGYTLAVTHPCCGNLGGGGFMLIHLANGENHFLNFREKAPLAATSTMYLDAKGQVIPNKSLLGYAAVAVPGTVMGLNMALEKYGRFSRAKVMQRAILLAKEGFVITEHENSSFQKILEPGFPLAANAAAIFLNKGKPYQAPEKLVQTNLAKTLENIASKGSDAFYKGDVPAQIVKESQAQGGYLSMEDFATYTVQDLPPIVCTYRGYTVISAPPPSSGGVTLCEILNILEGYPLANYGFHSALASHYMIEAMRFAFADRNYRLADPDFVRNPIKQLLSKDYAKQIRNQIKAYGATPSKYLPLQPSFKESVQTTHYSIADKEGNLVSVTYTLNGNYGAHVMAGDTGFFLNNQMDDFSMKAGGTNQFGLVEGAANIILPQKRPLSSMTPTIVFKGRLPFLVLGSPGGPRIISSVLQTLINVIDFGMDIKTAVDSPRFHHQWLPDSVDMEKFAFSKDTRFILSLMGYQFKLKAPWSSVQAIAIDAGPTFYGATDDRKPQGAAIAPSN